MDEKQMTSIFEQLQQRLSRYARGLFYHDEDAEDALQDAFCKLWTHRQDIRDPHHAQAVAFTQVKHASIDLHRRNERHSVVPLDLRGADGAYTHVAEEVENSDTFSHIEQIVMHDLSERERTVFAMKEYRDLSTEEIASHLGISPEAVQPFATISKNNIAVNYEQTTFYSQIRRRPLAKRSPTILRRITFAARGTGTEAIRCRHLRRAFPLA